MRFECLSDREWLLKVLSFLQTPSLDHSTSKIDVAHGHPRDLTHPQSGGECGVDQSPAQYAGSSTIAAVEKRSSFGGFSKFGDFFPAEILGSIDRGFRHLIYSIRHFSFGYEAVFV